MKTYVVTVTPKITSYAGSTVMESYMETLAAKNRDDAIKKARQFRTDQEGRHAVPVTYRARLAK